MTRWLLSANDIDPRKKSCVRYNTKSKCWKWRKYVDQPLISLILQKEKMRNRWLPNFKKKAVLFSKNILQKKNSIFVVDEVKLLSSLHTSSKRLLSSHLTTIQHNLRDQHSQGNLEQSHLSNARNWSYFFLGNFPSLFWAWWWTVLMFHCLKFQKERHFQGKSSHS